MINLKFSFVGEVISKTRASCFIGVSNTRKQFISFLVFETPMKHSHSFLKYYLTHLALALVKGNREPHEAKKKSFDLGGNRT